MSELAAVIQRPSMLVADFDSVEQARIWRTLGPSEAIRRFVAMLRTSLLLGESIYVDSNQLFDGVVFLALGPDGIRRVLGLNDWNRLPFILGVPPRCAVDEFEAGRHLLSRFLLTEPDEFASSAFLALDPTEGMPKGQTRTDHLRMLFQGIEPRPHTDLSFEELPLEQLERFSAEAIPAARDAWITELLSQKLRVCAWPVVQRTMNRDLWESAIEELSVYPDSQARARRLGERIEIYENEHSCAVRRSNVVTWLAEEFDLAGQPTNAELDLPKRTAEARAALRWWSRHYYDAILKTGGAISLERIAFTDMIPSALNVEDKCSSQTYDDVAEEHWGLRTRAPSKIRLFMQRLIPRRQGSDIRLDGESITALATIRSYDFKTIWTSERAKLIKEGAYLQSRNFDLTLLIREAAQESPGWGQRVRRSMIRFIVFLVAAVSLAFRESGFLGGSSTGEVIMWLIVAVAAAFPFDDFFELWKVGPVTMMASIRMVQSA